MISAQSGEGFALYSLPTNRFYTSETAFEKLSDGLYRSESGGEIAFYGRGGIAAGVPCVIGDTGVDAVLEIDLSYDERRAMRKSCAIIRDYCEKALPAEE